MQLEWILEVTGLTDRRRHTPRELSGGQQQRVAIARALIGNPEILFADEPTGNLDSNTSDDVMNSICDVMRARNKTLVMVTHDPHMAEFADKVIQILDGKVVSIEYNDHSNSNASARVRFKVWFMLFLPPVQPCLLYTSRCV